ncbi:hypothetical protein [Magnetospira sp. QH-2]|uniref:hypothetical protein n=1 Tax=Magnetospira sp. (strain QH-2) TaxID=1288970 RepID=UPI0003E813AE|nr:hypothetical protein [Magnetospira sp. QH-2]CCQ72072.1 protein of unknown function [Magnetospira sp. QH-2]
MTCEIYICKPGQPLKEGRMEMNHDVTCKEEAISDAERRIKMSPSIGKIAYYLLSDSGSFRCIYTHNNEAAAKAAPPKRRSGGGPSGPVRVKKKKKKPKGLLAKLKAWAGE